MHNITLAYFLAFFKNSWFWLGVWIFYYLQYTDYSGIGIIEAVMILTVTLAEIPTGAIADILGKKSTLILSFLFQGLGNILMAFSPTLSFLLLSVFFISLGAALFSGSFEALVYDTLKEKKQTSKYDKIIANITSLQLIAPALCGALGGFMYVKNPALPFVAAGFFYLLGCLLSFFLREPKFDSLSFSWKAFILQTKQGFKQLTKTAGIRAKTVMLLSIGIIIVIVDEMLNSFLGVEFGFNESQMGILWAIILLLSAATSQLTPLMKKTLGEKQALMFTGMIVAFTLIMSPVIGLVMGGVTLLLRSAFQSIYTNFSSIMINNVAQSRYRATTLSTFNMLKNLPYVICAYLFGVLSDIFTARLSALYLGIILVFLLLMHLYRPHVPALATKKIK